MVKPCFTDVYRDRGEAIGVAEFETMEEMRTAIRRLDDTEFKNPFEKSYIRIIEVSSSSGLGHKTSIGGQCFLCCCHKACKHTYGTGSRAARVSLSKAASRAAWRLQWCQLV